MREYSRFSPAWRQAINTVGLFDCLFRSARNRGPNVLCLAPDISDLVRKATHFLIIGSNLNMDWFFSTWHETLLTATDDKVFNWPALHERSSAIEDQLYELVTKLKDAEKACLNEEELGWLVAETATQVFKIEEEVVHVLHRYERNTRLLRSTAQALASKHSGLYEELEVIQTHNASLKDVQSKVVALEAENDSLKREIKELQVAGQATCQLKRSVVELFVENIQLCSAGEAQDKIITELSQQNRYLRSAIRNAER
ncbi:hypothetical protein BDV96DRAFT_663511 [Lophiotrema nucula]|uniref:Uncharacterized protein n=1 Tax=Lophiotrema nucula TaxID=690887 RepID=A0A6A5ZVV8_9PLEO|nr:hypothetical protein BDV96DRAFT_663511 [Lophiotrema nucula]